MKEVIFAGCKARVMAGSSKVAGSKVAGSWRGQVLQSSIYSISSKSALGPDCVKTDKPLYL